MKKDDVVIGAMYIARAGGRLVYVRIERESRHGGWETLNTCTGRLIWIENAKRLRRIVARAERDLGLTRQADGDDDDDFRD